MFFESLLLALALCVDSLAVSTATAFSSHISWRRGFLLAAVFGFFQGLLPLAGALIGVACERFMASIDHWIAFAMLAVVGGRMIWESFHKKGDTHKTNFADFRMIVVMAIATSIDAFVVGVGFGMYRSLSEILFIVAVIAVVTFLVSLSGVALGRRHIPIPERWTSFAAGCVLILLGTHTLIEHLLTE